MFGFHAVNSKPQRRRRQTAQRAVRQTGFKAQLVVAVLRTSAAANAKYPSSQFALGGDTSKYLTLASSARFASSASMP